MSPHPHAPHAPSTAPPGAFTPTVEDPAAPPDAPARARTLRGLPRPGGVLAVAAGVALVLTAALAYATGWAYGEPPLAPFPTLTATAYRYNALARSTPANAGEVLLIGSSLTRHGVIEEELARALREAGRPVGRVVNLAMDASGVWQQLRLVRRLEPPRATGAPRVAVVDVRRDDFNDGFVPRYARWDLARRGGGWAPKSPWARLALLRDLLPTRQPADVWLDEIRYGVVGRIAPRLVAIPPAGTPYLWTMSAAGARRATAKNGPVQQARKLSHRRVARHATGALRALVAALHARGYRVVLWVPASHSRYLALLDATPGNAAAEAEFRARVLSPAATGADTVLALGGAADIGTTDSVFYDYGHLTRYGATLQTRVVARFLVESGVLRGR